MRGPRRLLPPRAGSCRVINRHRGRGALLSRMSSGRCRGKNETESLPRSSPCFRASILGMAHPRSTSARRAARDGCSRKAAPGHGRIVPGAVCRSRRKLRRCPSNLAGWVSEPSMPLPEVFGADEAGGVDARESRQREDYACSSALPPFEAIFLDFLVKGLSADAPGPRPSSTCCLPGPRGVSRISILSASSRVEPTGILTSRSSPDERTLGGRSSGPTRLPDAITTALSTELRSSLTLPGQG